MFDGDSSTNVVCEGYSKAFQYLCDQSSWNGDVSCYSVSGYLTSGSSFGGHMWNVVTMSNGKNYLVDVTNSDSGTIGSEGELFLAGYDTVSNDTFSVTVSGAQRYLQGYRINCTYGTVGFYYHYNLIWDASVLDLADSDYVKPASWSVTFKLTNLAADGSGRAQSDTDYRAVLTAPENYAMPETVSVTVGGVNYTGFTYEDGVLVIPAAAITGDIVITAQAVYVLASFPGQGSGTEEDPYLVSSASELDAVRYFDDAYFLQTADINMTGVNWTPIPDISGAYDGGGYTITGLAVTCTNTENTAYLGGLVNRAAGKLTDIHVKNINLIMTDTVEHPNMYPTLCVGGLVGQGGQIMDCSVSGTVNVTMRGNGYGRVGGVAGMAGSVYGCVNEAAVTVAGIVDNTVTSGGNHQLVGGVVGRADVVQESANLGAVSVDSAGDYYRYYKVGGVAGYGSGERCYNRGAVTLQHGHNAYLGGVVGESAVTPMHSYNAGAVTAALTGNSYARRYVGGVVGTSVGVEYCYNAGTIIASGTTTVGAVRGSGQNELVGCYYLDSSIGTTADGAAALTDEQMRRPASFPDFDFAAIWCYGTDESYAYPVLRAFGDVGHVFSVYISNNDGTCEQDGTETAWCDVCGEVSHTRTNVGSAPGHAWSEWQLIQPTYIRDGSRKRSCGTCHEEEEEILPATGQATVDAIGKELEGNTVTLTDVPEDVVTMVAFYQKGRLVYVCEASAQNDRVISIPEGIGYNRARVFFLTVESRPIALATDLNV